jgi:hypothetical protein
MGPDPVWRRWKFGGSGPLRITFMIVIDDGPYDRLTLQSSLSFLAPIFSGYLVCSIFLSGLVIPMGWFWGNNSQNDPTKKLDPELRQFLEEGTTKYSPTTTIQPSKETPTSSDSTKPSPSVPASDAADSKPPVPSASLFPDGRYADLWKTYKPLAEIEGSEAASAERVIEKFKQRKDTVSQAAMENCAIEHEGLSLCFQKGDWWSMVKARATMCAEENRRFSRCYTTQAVGFSLSCSRWLGC